MNDILASDEVAYREEFAWEVKIIQNDDVLNAFATPGGYIYVYTGLIKYLDNEDDLAGVLGHEIAHADLRHTSRQLQRQYGISILLSVALGQDAGTLEQIVAQIAGGLAGLRFSREFEEEADSRSVDYLADTDYACNSAASFFQKLLQEGESNNPPEFLSTHPSPDNRVADINAKAQEINCDTTPLDPASFDSFKASLP
jgi:predicted Zn-dependent protease